MRTGILAAATAALLLQSGVASAKRRAPAPPPAPAVIPYQSANLPSAAEVRAFYSRYNGSIWYRGGVQSPAAGEFLNVLTRSALDGFAMGPQIAAQVRPAMQRAATRDPAAVAFADRTLSEALVLYARAMKRPVQGMIYGYKELEPKPLSADEILMLAAASPSRSVQQLSNPNPIYAGIRDAAWQQMQSTGSMIPDARVVANLDRARAIPAGGRFLLVDAATQRLFMYENGVPVDSMKVIVGTSEMKTPMIASYMYYVAFNPYWNAPDHLVRKAIAPNVLSQGVKYLKARGYEVMENWNADSPTIAPEKIDWKAVAAGKVKLRIRQKPSDQNFMGDLKFPFANPEDIYLHDTPNKALFAKDSRDLSNGCVRVEDAARLGRWLLGREPVAPSSEPELQVQVPRAVPIYITYLTAQPSGGQLTFVSDVYGLDPAAATQVAASQ